MKIPDYNKKIKHPTYLKMQEEIERLKEEYIILQNASDEVEEEKDKEIERLHSIIKEVRAKLYDLNYKIKEIHNVPFDISEIFEMIEILDKEEK